MGGIPSFGGGIVAVRLQELEAFPRARPSHVLAARHRCLRPAAEHKPPPQHRYPGAPTCKTSPVWSSTTTRLAGPRADVPCRRVSLINVIGCWIVLPAGDRFIDQFQRPATPRKLIL